MAESRGGPDPRLSDPGWLEERYHGEGLSLREIADERGVSASAVLRWMDEHGIETRGCTAEGAPGELRDGDWLRRRYVDEGLSQREIADELGCSQSAVSRAMDEHGIKARPSSVHVTGEEPYSDPSWLRRKYWDEGMSAREIAAELDVTYKTVLRYLGLYGIGTRGGSGGVPEEELLRDVSRVARDVGRWPTMAEYDEAGRFSSRTVHRRFGGWFAAREAAQGRFWD